MPKKIIILFLFGFLLSASILADQGTGAIVKQDCKAYTSSKAEKEEFEVKAGAYCAFWKAMTWGNYKAENGYIRVSIFVNNDYGIEKFTWIAEDNLEFFFFPCMSSEKGFLQMKEKVCMPIQVKGLQHQWSLEYRVAAKAKCKELGIDPPKIALISITPLSSQPNSTNPNQPIIDK